MRARSWLGLKNDGVRVLGRALRIRERVIEVVTAGCVGEQCQVALRWFQLSCDEKSTGDGTSALLQPASHGT